MPGSLTTAPCPYPERSRLVSCISAPISIAKGCRPRSGRRSARWRSPRSGLRLMRRAASASLHVVRSSVRRLGTVDASLSSKTRGDRLCCPSCTAAFHCLERYKECQRHCGGRDGRTQPCIDLTGLISRLDTMHSKEQVCIYCDATDMAYASLESNHVYKVPTSSGTWLERTAQSVERCYGKFGFLLHLKQTTHHKLGTEVLLHLKSPHGLLAVQAIQHLGDHTKGTA
jgi:hypothetical protein